MKQTKTNHIAVAYDENKKCVMVCVCKMADDNEVAKLMNEVAEHKQKEADEKQALKDEIKKCKDEITELNKEVKLLKGED